MEIRNSGHLHQPQCTRKEEYRENTETSQGKVSNASFAEKGAEYTTTVGSYCEWSTSVNLEPPFPVDVKPPEDIHILDYYNALQYTLYETGYPETEDRTTSPRSHLTGNDVSITILSSPVECMAILLEGGRQCPEGMLLVLSTTWLSRKESETYSDLHSLYVHKAISFGRAGQTFLDVFNPPRRCTYFVNFFTRACTDSQRADGEVIEKGLDCPMSSSLQLVKLVDDKVWTRELMAEVGMAYPETLAFVYQSEVSYSRDKKNVTVIQVSDKREIIGEIMKEVTRFLAAFVANKVVVKPSGAMWHGSHGVSYHNGDDVAVVTSSVIELMNVLDPGDAVMVETFCETVLPINHSDGIKWAAMDDLGIRIRSTVCRTHDNKTVTSAIICNNGPRNRPINGDNTVPQSLDTTLYAFGVINPEERRHIEEDISDKSEALLSAIIKREKKMSLKEKGEIGGQTDVIGIDLILCRKDDVFTPVGIEVNSHDCTINCQIFEFMNTENSGKTVRPLVETMVTRSQKFMMIGRTILVIGAGGDSKAFIWPEARRYDMKVILVDSDPSHFARKQVHQFIMYDYSDHTKDLVHAINIMKLLEKEAIVIEGCLTFWEDCGPLAACICHLMDLPGPGLKAAQIAKCKSATHTTLRTKIGDIPHWPRTYLYTSKTSSIKSNDDLVRISKQISFPAVFKLDYGSSAVGVTIVRDRQELQNRYLDLKTSLKNDRDYPGIGLGYGNDTLLMDYLEGTEHDVDIIIFKRKIVAAFVSDNGPTRLPYFTETSATMPSVLPMDKQNQLITAAYQCCTEIGLVNGVFNVELILTPVGPKLLEINARMGGFYLRDWIRRCYGVDIMLCAFMIASGIKPIVSAKNPNGHLIGVMCLPSLHSHLLSDHRSHDLLRELCREDVVFNIFSKDTTVCNEKYEEPFGNIGVIGSSKEKAKKRLLQVVQMLKITSKDYDVESFLHIF